MDNPTQRQQKKERKKDQYKKAFSRQHVEQTLANIQEPNQPKKRSSKKGKNNKKK